ncbi:cysteine hydrolase [Gordonia sp. CPCC 206044]|uniref:cysteine hydrolase family protein n=1 Tax=Gordonia sp. CPCC 206044 TaxID=3140793 RepID=UPI003AF34B9A
MDSIPFRYDPTRCALVVIDMQNDFCSPQGSLAQRGFDVGAAVAMAPRLERLIGLARAADVRVVFVRTLHDATTDTPQWLGRIGDEPDAVRTGITCRTGTPGADFYGIEVDDDDVVITKNRFSGFVGTNLDLTLRSLGVDSLLFTGVATEVCVESTLRHALFHEYWVTLVEDCAATYSRAAHEASVSVVAQNFGTVITAEKLESFWSALSST